MELDESGDGQGSFREMDGMGRACTGRDLTEIEQIQQRWFSCQ